MKLGRIIGCVGVGSIFTLTQIQAQVALSGGTYQQDFQSLATTGTANAWGNNVTLPGWYAAAESGFGDYRANSGGSTVGDLYSFGASGSTERALGSLASGTTGSFAYGLRFVNDTGQELTSFRVSYTGEQWRNSASTAPQWLTFSYWTGSTPFGESDLLSGTGWTSAPALDFLAPSSGGTARALDGNLSENREVFGDVSLTGLNLQPGQELALRWYDVNDATTDHALGIDDVHVTFDAASASPIPEPQEYGLLMGAVALWVVHYRHRQARASQRC